MYFLLTRHFVSIVWSFKSRPSPSWFVVAKESSFVALVSLVQLLLSPSESALEVELSSLSEFPLGAEQSSLIESPPEAEQSS